MYDYFIKLVGFVFKTGTNLSIAGAFLHLITQILLRKKILYDQFTIHKYIYMYHYVMKFVRFVFKTLISFTIAGAFLHLIS